MTIAYTLTVVCDYPDCHEESEAAVTTLGSATARHDVRLLAAEQGWHVAHSTDHRGARFDLCPDHASEVPGRTFEATK